MIEIDIEETIKYAEYGIVVFSENGKLTYFKPRKLSIEESEKASIEGEPQVEFELVPLTSEEMKQYGIIEETDTSENSEFDIEESELSTEEKLKKVREALAKEEADKQKANLTLSGEPQAVKEAKNILEKEMQKRKEDTATKEQLEEENEDLKNKLAIIAEKQFEAKRNSVSAPSDIDTPEKLEGFIKAKEAFEKTGKKTESAGSQLVPQQFGAQPQQNEEDIPLRKRKFNSTEEMIRFLHSEPQTAEKDRALSELMWKFTRDWKNSGHPEQHFSPDDNVERKTGNPEPLISENLRDSENSELEKFHIKKHKDGERWGEKPQEKGD